MVLKLGGILIERKQFHLKLLHALLCNKCDKTKYEKQYERYYYIFFNIL